MHVFVLKNAVQYCLIQLIKNQFLLLFLCRERMKFSDNMLIWNGNWRWYQFCSFLFECGGPFDFSWLLQH